MYVCNFISTNALKNHNNSMTVFFSGHGITGMGFMSILSLIATASMFGGGMATGFGMKYLLGTY